MCFCILSPHPNSVHNRKDTAIRGCVSLTRVLCVPHSGSPGAPHAWATLTFLLLDHGSPPAKWSWQNVPSLVVARSEPDFTQHTSTVLGSVPALIKCELQLPFPLPTVDVGGAIWKQRNSSSHSCWLFSKSQSHSLYGQGLCIKFALHCWQGKISLCLIKLNVFNN